MNDDWSYPRTDMKETMKAFGLVPSEQMRQVFGWTAEDDKEGAEALLNREQRRLAQKIAEGCSLREEMQFELQIDGIRNGLKDTLK